MNLYEKLKDFTINTILLNLNQTEELPDVYSAPQNTYQAESQELQKRINKVEASSNQLIRKVFSGISAVLASQPENRHLEEAQYGTDVTIRAYWKRCGFNEIKPRGAVYPDPDTIRFQFEDKAVFQIKCDMPLKPIYSLKEAVDRDIRVPEYAYAPSVFKIFADHVLPMQTPGFFRSISLKNIILN